MAALKVAQSNGDVSSVVRWLTLFGHGYVQLAVRKRRWRSTTARWRAAAAVPEIQFPVMTHVGRSNALIRLGRLEEADGVLAKAGEVAARSDALGYQAQLLSQRGAIANQRGQSAEAVTRFSEALASPGRPAPTGWSPRSRWSPRGSSDNRRTSPARSGRCRRA